MDLKTQKRALHMYSPIAATRHVRPAATLPAATALLQQQLMVLL